MSARLIVFSATILKNNLENLYIRYSSNFLETDPIVFPHRYTNKADIEIVAFISAVFAYGKVSLFQPKIEQIILALGKKPSETIIDFIPEKSEALKGFYYRFQKQNDLFIFLKTLSDILKEYGSLEKLFLTNYQESDENIIPALYSFVLNLRNHLQKYMNPLNHGLSHLIPSPQNAALKRMNMFLRWMVRKDAVDFGIWNKVSPSKLIIPVDTHINRIAGYLNLSKRKNANIKTAIEITNSLKKICPEDPVKYDFSLTRLGMTDCMANKKTNCDICIVRENCAVYNYKPNFSEK